jgi:hypothetical protein
MKSLLQFVKNIKLKNILTMLLASSLIFINTACSKGDVAQVRNSAGAETTEKVASDTYDQYDAKQQYKGGMNGYNDDRRYDPKTAAKTKALVDTAKSRQKDNDNLGEYTKDLGDRAGDKIKEAKRDIPRTLGANKEEAVDYLQDKSANLKRNLKKVPGGAKDVFDGAVDTAQDAIDDANQSTKSTAKDIKGNVKDLT